MKQKIFNLIVAALFIQCSLFAQTELPVIKANSNKVDIKVDTVLRKNLWTVMPELALDVYPTAGKEVTFYTDIDSISFIIDPKIKKYDFIILLNEKDSARTQIQYQKQSRDVKEFLAISFEMFTLIPVNRPQNFNPRAINQSFRYSISYRAPLRKSNFSLSIGAGISFHNYYIDALPKDMLPVSMQLEEYGKDFYFKKIASLAEPEISYKKNKMNLTYLDIPLELRYANKKGFRVSAGAKIDFLVNSYFKFEGSDFIFGSDEDIKLKKYRLEHLSNVQFGPIVRIGWKSLHAYASYSFIPVYNVDAGSKLNPVCIGVSFIPLY